MTEETEAGPGGVDWELRTALKMASAARLSGDFAAEGVAWIRFSEGLRNLTGAQLASQLIPMLQALRDVQLSRESDARIFQHNMDLLITQAEIEQGYQAKQDVRIAMIEVSILTYAVLQTEIFILQAQVKALENARDADLASQIESLQTARASERDARDAAADAAKT